MEPRYSYSMRDGEYMDVRIRWTEKDEESVRPSKSLGFSTDLTFKRHHGDETLSQFILRAEEAARSHVVEISSTVNNLRY